MGLILERSGMAEDLLDTIGQVFGSIRGGVAYAVVFVGALLAATTGVVAASVLAMGLISLPVMMRYGYSNRLSTGVIAASGTLAQIIPPSLVLIVLADQMGASVGDMYEGALIPGARARRRSTRSGCSSSRSSSRRPRRRCPPEMRTLHGAQAAALRVFTSMIPPLVLIFLVLGTIFLGVATPTEGGAWAPPARSSWRSSSASSPGRCCAQAVESTATMTSFVMFILVGSTVFSLVFRGVDGDLWVERLLLHVPGGALGFLIVVNVMIFLLAFFLDYFEIAFIMVPLLTPVAQKLGIDLIWFGVLLAVNMQTSFLHPPFGFALFYLRSVAPKSVKTSDIYWGAIPFVVIQVLMVATIIAFPGIVTSNVTAGRHGQGHGRGGAAAPAPEAEPGAADSGKAPALARARSRTTTLRDRAGAERGRKSTRPAARYLPSGLL